jgi:hypothetical protein
VSHGICGKKSWKQFIRGGSHGFHSRTGELSRAKVVYMSCVVESLDHKFFILNVLICCHLHRWLHTRKSGEWHL